MFEYNLHGIIYVRLVCINAFTSDIFSRIQHSYKKAVGMVDSCSVEMLNIYCM